METESKPAEIRVDMTSSFAGRVSFLQSTQNSDGGWGFRPECESRVEPTAWVLLALQEADSAREWQQSGVAFLRKAQLADGSWPASNGQMVGHWATSLASWALFSNVDSHEAATAGLRWICNDWPRSTSMFQRVIRRLSRTEKVSAQNDSLAGWGWTTGTASWVEPTAFALLCLQRAPKKLLPGGDEKQIQKRVQRGKALLCDRMCRGGGWNCGNPMVYGVPGDPSIPQTVWALLALRGEKINMSRAEGSPRIAHELFRQGSRTDQGTGLALGSSRSSAQAGPQELCNSKPVQEDRRADGSAELAPDISRNSPETAAQALSLQWLEDVVGSGSGRGAASLALARICLDAYGRPWPAGAPSLEEALEGNEFTRNVVTTAWICLAETGWMKQENG